MLGINERRELDRLIASLYPDVDFKGCIKEHILSTDEYRVYISNLDYICCSKGHVTRTCTPIATTRELALDSGKPFMTLNDDSVVYHIEYISPRFVWVKAFDADKGFRVFKDSWTARASHDIKSVHTTSKGYYVNIKGRRRYISDIIALGQLADAAAGGEK